MSENNDSPLQKKKTLLIQDKSADVANMKTNLTAYTTNPGVVGVVTSGTPPGVNLARDCQLGMFEMFKDYLVEFIKNWRPRNDRSDDPQPLAKIRKTRFQPDNSSFGSSHSATQWARTSINLI